MLIDNELCNMSLATIAHSLQISDIVNDTSKEANVLRLFYPTVIEQVFSDCPWPKQTKTVALAELAVNPREDEYGYAYRYPSDCFAFRGILPSGAQHLESVKDFGVEYTFGRDAAGVIIFTDEEDAIAVYGTITEDPKKWSGHMRMAVAYLLGSNIAVAITGGDQLKLGDRALQRYGLWITKAKALAFNEVRKPPTTSSIFTRARRRHSGS